MDKIKRFTIWAFKGVPEMFHTKVVGSCPESLILNHLTFPFKYNSIMTYPIFSIPKR